MMCGFCLHATSFQQEKKKDVNFLMRDLVAYLGGISIQPLGLWALEEEPGPMRSRLCLWAELQQVRLFCGAERSLALREGPRVS